MTSSDYECQAFRVIAKVFPVTSSDFESGDRFQRIVWFPVFDSDFRWENRMITIMLLALLAVLVTGFILIVFLRVFNKINTKQCDCPVDLNFKDKVGRSLRLEGP